MPLARRGHVLEAPLLIRTLRLNCLTEAYAPLWKSVYDKAWQHEHWTTRWPGASRLEADDSNWSVQTPLRAEIARRAALVELDCLVSAWLNIGVEELIATFRARYPVLSKYDASTWFDANGRKIAAHHDNFGVGQTKDHYNQLMVHLEDPANCAPPAGYEAPFYKADREREYREVHAVFSKRLQDAIDAGWSPS